MILHTERYRFEENFLAPRSVSQMAYYSKYSLIRNYSQIFRLSNLLSILEKNSSLLTITKHRQENKKAT